MTTSPLCFAFLFLLSVWSGALTGEAKTFYANKQRGFAPFEYATPQGIRIFNESDSLKYDYLVLEKPVDYLSLDFRAKNLHGSPSKKYKFTNSDGKTRRISQPEWGFFLTTLSDTIVIKIHETELSQMHESVPALRISIFSFFKNSENIVDVTENINRYSGDNLFSLQMSDSRLMLLGGDTGLHNLAEDFYKGEITGFGFFCGWGGDILISDIKADYEFADSIEARISIEDIDLYLQQSKDEMEGYWVIFDRELEENLLKLGGDYKLACIREGEEYNFIYLEGASINRNQWQAGDLKIKLSPSPFPEIYNVLWIDSEGESLSKDVKAQKGDGMTLTIQFPYQASKVRLRKIPD